MRTDAAIARLTACVATIAGKSKASGEPFGRDDFMPYLDEAEISLEEAMKQWT